MGVINRNPQAVAELHCRLIMMTKGILLITISVLAVIGDSGSAERRQCSGSTGRCKRSYRAAAFDDALTSFEVLATNISSATPLKPRGGALPRVLPDPALAGYRGAEQAIEGIILAEPTYIPSESEVSTVN